MINVICNIFVIGFHHKRGCEVEFIYPPLNDLELTTSLPENWKNLSSLALPDGAHKSDSDIFHFVLPNDRNSEPKVLFGISCFKQISSDNIKNKSEDITRNSIQKSVVILSKQPIFNAIGSLLQGITENYFDIGDFSQRDILIESYHQLNEHFRLIREDNTIKHNNEWGNLIDQGLSVSDLIIRYEHNVFSLIKLIILRRKLVFSMEPTSKLTTTILCLVSLFTGEYTSSKFQNIMKYLEGNSADDDSSISINTFDTNEDVVSDFELNGSLNDSEKPANNENKSSTGTSLFQNIKSGGGQAIKVFSNFAASSLMRSSESDLNTKQSQIDDLSAPLPPFVDKVGYVRDNDKLNCYNLRDSWGFPLGIFDEKNILLPYASLGYLNVLDNKKINSFIIGASNHLWRMKHAKLDAIINEDNKSGGIEYYPKETNHVNKKVDDTLMKLAQLTVLDRRLADYLLGVVKAHNSPILKTSSSTNISQVSYVKNNGSNEDLTTIEIGEDVLVAKPLETEPIHKFTDQKSLDEWLRQVLTDYIRALLLSAAGLGTRQSFNEFGWDFMTAVQQLEYFEDWYYSIDKESIIHESNYSPCTLMKSESSLSLNISSSSNKDNIEPESARKLHKIMTFDHPGRFITSRLGDNLPGYYQIKEYADQSKALVNRSVNEIKRIGTERGSQLKSSISAGLSKLSGVAKIHSTRLGSSWWSTDTKATTGAQDDGNDAVAQ